jgi:broad specificity phosphatase PhoE
MVDSPLTQVGLEQAERLAAYWREYPPGFERRDQHPAGHMLG